MNEVVEVAFVVFGAQDDSHSFVVKLGPPGPANHLAQ